MESQNEKQTGKSQGNPGSMNKNSGNYETQSKPNAGNDSGEIRKQKKSQVESERKYSTGGDHDSNNSSNNYGLLKIIGAVAGGALLLKGAKGLFGSNKHSGNNKENVIDIHTRFIVKRPKEELFAYWRDLENLPNFMSHLEEVTMIDEKKSHWVAEIPGGFGTIAWDAEIIWEQKNHILDWKSLPGSEIENSGEVRFEDAGRNSTVVETRISYRPPAGQVGGFAAKLLNPAFKKVVESDMQQFKKYMEKGGDRKRKRTAASRM